MVSEGWSRPLVERLGRELRRQPNIRLAVLYGSVSRAEGRDDSDLDLLVELCRDDHLARAEAAEALEIAVGRRVELISLDEAEAAPALLAAVLRDGRVLVDAERQWTWLKRRQPSILAAARRADERVQRLAWTTPDALAQIQRRRLGFGDGR
jgi:predicted nucleotidyltransferase